ncbi:MAG: hypothetical protein LQ346_008627, partial [Caloplaca aetnensis]
MSTPTSLPTIIFILALLTGYASGPPGSGKSFLCKQAVGRIPGLKHVVMSDLLHEAKKNASAPHAEEIARKLPTGTLVGGEVAISILGDFLRTFTPDSAPTILLDGFPRNIEQAQAFEKNLGFALATISLTCSAATCKKRREERARQDDSPETGDARYQGHLDDTVPAIEYLRRNNIRVVEVSSEKTGDEGYLDFADALM